MNTAPTISMTKTDTITARYAELPVTSLSIDYLVQVLTPMPLIPVVHKIARDSEAPLELLKKELMNQWLGFFQSGTEYDNDPSVIEVRDMVKKVELVECDLLVPKTTK